VPRLRHHHVALIHDGAVLWGPDGRLPTLVETGDDLDESDLLGLVGGQIPLAPARRLDADSVLHVVGLHRVDPPPGAWLPVDRVPAEIAGGIRRALAPEPPDRRPAWYRPGWYDEVESWLDDVLAGRGRRRTGPAWVHRVWGLSAVLRVETETGPLWFKAACDHFRQEAAVHAVLDARLPGLVPAVVAADESRGWLLLEELAGHTDATRAPGAAAAVADRYPAAQAGARAWLPDLRTAGAPERSLSSTLRGWRELLDREIERGPRADLSGVAGDVERQLTEFWDCGFPDTLVHGDLHLGNVAHDGLRVVLFDWTDACVSHPLLDAQHLLRSSGRDTRVAELIRHRWQEAFPRARDERGLRLAPLAHAVFNAVSYDGIHHATEPGSMWELRDVLPRLLGRIPDLVAELNS
jgi:Phosphotransferase enzyme family